MKPADVQIKLQEHDRFWEDQRPEQEALKDIYETRFFSIPDRSADQIQVQTSDAFGYIEGIIGQLYARNPACVIRSGMRALGDVEVAQTVSNGFLAEECREAISHGTRLALIHPMSFIKLVPRDTEDPYKKVLPVAVPPWEVIVDKDAPTWEESRYVGHAYWESLTSVKAKFGNNRKWLARRRMPYFKRDRYENEDRTSMPAAMATKFDEYVRMVEFYATSAPLFRCTSRLCLIARCRGIRPCAASTTSSTRRTLSAVSRRRLSVRWPGSTSSGRVRLMRRTRAT